MKSSKSQRPRIDPSSKEAVNYAAARQIINKVEGKIAEEEENEQLEKPGRILMRIMVGSLLAAWIMVMCWIAVKSMKKKDQANFRLQQIDYASN